jgi:predicted PurR-regulated permease PerM
MTNKYPFYIRCTVVLFGLVLLVYCLAILQQILVPIAFALMLSILLNPLEIRLERWHFPRILAIAMVIIIGLFVLIAVGYLLYIQMASFSSELPMFKKKLTELFSKIQFKASHDWGISMTKQNEYIGQAENGLKPVLTAAMGTAMGTISMIILLPVYTFLFLYYKTLILNFLYELFAEKNAKEVGLVLTQTKGAVQSYMVGLLLEAIIVATLNATALFILGVDYAILLGVLGALLNVLPFIGGILAVLLPILIATVTKDGFHTQFGIIIAYLIIQFVDNHFLVPYIVSSKVKINALVSIVIVFMGGALWGISGMFLSIPFIGVLKIIFDRVEELKVWGKLLGKEVPITHRGQMQHFKAKWAPAKKK